MWTVDIFCSYSYPRANIRKVYTYVKNQEIGARYSYLYIRVTHI
jgi:hypothetical protein